MLVNAFLLYSTKCLDNHNDGEKTLRDIYDILVEILVLCNISIVRQFNRDIFYSDHEFPGHFMLWMYLKTSPLKTCRD